LPPLAMLWVALRDKTRCLFLTKNTALPIPETLIRDRP